MSIALTESPEFSSSSAHLPAGPRVICSGRNFDFAFEVNSNGNSVALDTNLMSSSRQVLVDEHEHHVWNRRSELRYNVLARKESLEGLTPQEEHELNSLTNLRRNALYPMKADEILWQRKQERLADDLVEALQKYVQFLEAPRNP